MKHVLQVRIDRIFSCIENGDAPDALFIYNSDRLDRNFLYLTGLSGGVFENCGVLAEKDGRLALFSTTLEEEILREVDGHTDFFVYRNEEERNTALRDVLTVYDGIGVSFEAVSHSTFLNLRDLIGATELTDMSRAFKKARMIKSPDEVERIRAACDIVSAVADEFPGFLRVGVTERELASEIEYQMRKMGARGPAFETIVAFSPNNSKPHYSGSDSALKNGDVVLLDFGAEYEGYVSDITRTYLTGAANSEKRHCYETVLQAQRIALDLIVDGEDTEKVDREVKSFIDSHDRYRDRFIHGLGHSIGLSVHDNSYPGADFDKTFRENMVLTVEPGIYLPGAYGIRIEDDVVVGKGSSEVLTKAAKELHLYEI
jgi:Xaa-Pro aminopeptidase